MLLRCCHFYANGIGRTGEFNSEWLIIICSGHIIISESPYSCTQPASASSNQVQNQDYFFVKNVRVNHRRNVFPNTIKNPTPKMLRHFQGLHLLLRICRAGAYERPSKKTLSLLRVHFGSCSENMTARRCSSSPNVIILLSRFGQTNRYILCLYE